MDFGLALAALKSGSKVTRAGWNGKGMWIALQVPAPRQSDACTPYKHLRETCVHARPDAHSKMSCPYLFLRTADRKLVPWVASQTDLLADDWHVAD